MLFTRRFLDTTIFLTKMMFVFWSQLSATPLFRMGVHNVMTTEAWIRIIRFSSKKNVTKWFLRHRAGFLSQRIDFFCLSASLVKWCFLIPASENKFEGLHEGWIPKHKSAIWFRNGFCPGFIWFFVRFPFFPSSRKWWLGWELLVFFVRNLLGWLITVRKHGLRCIISAESQCPRAASKSPYALHNLLDKINL